MMPPDVCTVAASKLVDLATPAIPLGPAPAALQGGTRVLHAYKMTADPAVLQDNPRSRCPMRNLRIGLLTSSHFVTTTAKLLH
jgi:hypothetical protein